MSSQCLLGHPFTTFACPFFLLISFACYHIDNQILTPAQAEVSCGNLGGRLASFATNDELDLLAEVLRESSIYTEMWLGKELFATQFGFLLMYKF